MRRTRKATEMSGGYWAVEELRGAEWVLVEAWISPERAQALAEGKEAAG